MKLMNDETVKFILEYDILVGCNHTKQAGRGGGGVAITFKF